MDPVAKTAYYCCGARALDARRPDPVCGDHLAECFMDAPAWAIFERFAGLVAANAGNVARHRIIDDLLRARLPARPDLPVVLLGAGFDTRAFRLTGGRWLELDQPALLALKEARLPAARAPNRLQRVGIDFAVDSLVDRLAPWAGTAGAVVVMEGVSMYLDATQFGATARTLQRLLPGHMLVCDLIDARFIRRYGSELRAAIRNLGGDFAAPVGDPAARVASFGYRPVGYQSIIERAASHGSVPIPRWLLGSVFRGLRDGYRVWEFAAPG